MLGIVTPPLLQMFVQSHIIAYFFNKINPYFEKILFLFSFGYLDDKNSLSSPKKRTKGKPSVKMAKVQKVGIHNRERMNGYVNRYCIIPKKRLRKGPVEKPVESVEKFWFSTVFTDNFTI